MYFLFVSFSFFSFGALKELWSDFSSSSSFLLFSFLWAAKQIQHWKREGEEGRKEGGREQVRDRQEKDNIHIPTQVRRNRSSGDRVQLSSQ